MRRALYVSMIIFLLISTASASDHCTPKTITYSGAVGGEHVVLNQIYFYNSASYEWVDVINLYENSYNSCGWKAGHTSPESGEFEFYYGETLVASGVWTYFTYSGSNEQLSLEFNFWDSTGVPGNSYFTVSFTEGNQWSDVIYASSWGYASATDKIGIPIDAGNHDRVLQMDSFICYDDSAPEPNIGPTANFTATPTTGSLPLSVQFNDTSTETPLYWSWDFGDGFYYSGSSEFAQNPTHTYTMAGLFNVSLFVQNADGSDTETKTNYINVTTAIGTNSLKINPLTKNLTSMAGVNISIWSDSGYTNLVDSQETTLYIPYYSSSLPSNQMYYITLNKAGYNQANSSVFLNTNRDFDVIMYLPGETTPDTQNFTSMTVFVFSQTTGLSVPALVSYYTDSTHTALFGSAFVNSWTGSANMFLEQESNYYARITASGYYPYDFTVSTGTSASIERTYRLQPITTYTVTSTGTATPYPTRTLAPGETTLPADTRTNEQKGQSVIDIIYNNGEAIISLCVFATIMGLLNMATGGALFRFMGNMAGGRRRRR